jgi:hypothetical protein
MIEYYRDLAEQLANMPGGASNLREEFFGSVTRTDSEKNAWHLKSGGTLALTTTDGCTSLVWKNGSNQESIAEFPAGLLETALEFRIPAIGLAFLVLVMSGVSDGGKLKKLLPEVDKCAKSLLLIAVCRLCG